LLRKPDDGGDDWAFVVAITQYEEPDEEPDRGENPKEREPRPRVPQQEARRRLGRRR